MSTVELMLDALQEREKQILGAGVDRHQAIKIVIEESRVQEKDQDNEQMKRRIYLARVRYEKSHYSQVG